MMIHQRKNAKFSFSPKLMVFRSILILLAIGTCLLWVVVVDDDEGSTRDWNPSRILFLLNDNVGHHDDMETQKNPPRSSRNMALKPEFRVPSAMEKQIKELSVLFSMCFMIRRGCFFVQDMGRQTSFGFGDSGPMVGFL